MTAFTTNKDSNGRNHRMFSMIRKRATYANVAMTLALVFAMTGGAFAAKKYLITNTKQISPKVLKQLKGKPGPAGAQGPAGAAGAQGPAGPQGSAGAKGETGAEGKEGKEGKAGKEGLPGAIHPGETLPSEATETGTWGFATVEEPPFGFSVAYSPISFTMLLESALPAANVHKTGDTGFATACPGNAEEPEANPGQLCVYIAQTEGEVALEAILKAGASTATVGASNSGAILQIGVGKALPGTISGTWAVTAE